MKINLLIVKKKFLLIPYQIISLVALKCLIVIKDCHELISNLKKLLMASQTTRIQISHLFDVSTVFTNLTVCVSLL